ncbi:hypothetical protein CP532_2588 [Ophiocordyceps camponoti-leonardi (nom. inval.)]|nr:hypothetical protein CP532_2588 [Ophiocordyceps camponoti-leonardi (nom. inval.)]
MPASASARLRGASVLIALQLASRLTSFLANQFLLVRRVTAPQLGLAAKLDASAQTVLFFARDGLRVAVPRVAAAADERALPSQALVNLGYLAALVGAGFVLFLRLVLSLRHGGGDDGGGALAVYAVAAVVELLAEPAFLLMQARLSFGPRAAAESVAGLMRVLVVFLAVGSSSEDVLPFALGQLAYASALVVVYAFAARRVALDFSLLPRRVVRGPSAAFVGGYLYRPAVRLAGSVTAQGVVKHLLTQGDTLLVAVLASPSVQGVYALANNYGGLLARLLFQPVEESCRGYFSLLLSPEQQADADDKKQTVSKEKKLPSALVEARDSLTTLTRLYLVLSSVVVALGPFAAPPLLALVAGRRWSAAGAGSVLATYSLYVPFLAINGLAEAFVASVADERQLHRQSLAMAFFSLVFAAAAFVLMRVLGLGAHGLVVANMINLLCRICWCAVFIKAYFRCRRVDFSLTALLPPYTVGAAVALATTLVRTDVLDGAESEPVLTLARIAAWAIPFLAIILYLERSLLLQCLHSIRGQEAVKR